MLNDNFPLTAKRHRGKGPRTKRQRRLLAGDIAPQAKKRKESDVPQPPKVALPWER